MKKARVENRSSKFIPDPRKQYLKKFKIYPTFWYGRLDKWLKEMSKSGWHIVHVGWFFFWFERGEPLEKE